MTKRTPTNTLDKLAQLTHRELVTIRKEMATKTDLARFVSKSELHSATEDLRTELRTGFRDTVAAVEALLDLQTEKLARLIKLEQRVVRLERHANLRP